MIGNHYDSLMELCGFLPKISSTFVLTDSSLEHEIDGLTESKLSSYLKLQLI